VFTSTESVSVLAKEVKKLKRTESFKTLLQTFGELLTLVFKEFFVFAYQTLVIETLFFIFKVPCHLSSSFLVSEGVYRRQQKFKATKPDKLAS
jgi:hypothetical protein